MVHKAGTPLRRERSAAFRAAFDFGPSRTLQQDVEFGILQIVDIALKAISPAVNDPTTAIGCVDQLSRILIRLASREPPEPLLYDLHGSGTGQRRLDRPRTPVGVGLRADTHVREG